ncbi:hypothetical protein GCM10023340_31880 [Nocardioides marinquilinus]|uniref:Ig-like domain repeat protein n=1 Tax=Nocardioides marinquilinus TaxID=1210400 RepID=A0ABP9PWZ8_9ACTN
MSTLTRRLAAGVLTALAVPALALPHAAAETVGGPGDDGPVGPTPQVTVTVPDATDGWFADSVEVGISVTTLDELAPSGWTLRHGGQVVASGAVDESGARIEVTAEGISQLTYSVNGSGGGHREGSVTVQVDATDPAVAFDRTDPVTLSVGGHQLVGFDCTDVLSGARSCLSGRGGSPALLDTATRGRHVLTVTATDVAGNTATRQYAYDVVADDVTAPTLEATVSSGQRQGAWWTTPVGVRVTAEDPLVDHETRTGVHHTDLDLDGVVSSQQTDRRDVLVGEGRHVLRWAAADRAGNASGVGSMQVDVDTTRPVVDVAYPRPGQRLTTTSRPVPTFTCDDAVSGVVSCAALRDGDAHRGGLPQLDLTPGRHMLVVQATDAAGWLTRAEVRYVVAAAPVRSTTTLSRVTALRAGRGSARVQIVAGRAPRGKVVVTDGTRTIATVVVPRRAAHAGRTTFTLALPRLAAGRHVLRATYLGAADVRRSASRAVVVRVR